MSAFGVKRTSCRDGRQSPIPSAFGFLEIIADVRAAIAHLAVLETLRDGRGSEWSIGQANDRG